MNTPTMADGGPTSLAMARSVPISEAFDDAPDWAIILHAQNAEILETHRRILATVDEIKPEVMGVVASLQKNPMFKMFLGGK